MKTKKTKLRFDDLFTGRIVYLSDRVDGSITKYKVTNRTLNKKEKIGFSLIMQHGTDTYNGRARVYSTKDIYDGTSDMSDDLSRIIVDWPRRFMNNGAVDKSYPYLALMDDYDTDSYLTLSSMDDAEPLADVTLSKEVSFNGFNESSFRLFAKEKQARQWLALGPLNEEDVDLTRNTEL